MSKAFTKEDDDGGFTAPAPSARASSTSVITKRGAVLARARIAALANVARDSDAAKRDSDAAKRDLEIARLEGLLHARVAERAASATAAAFGAEVRLRNEAGKERIAVLASPDEVGLVPHAVSIASPLAQAVLGASPGDEIEIAGQGTWTVVAVAW